MHSFTLAPPPPPTPPPPHPTSLTLSHPPSLPPSLPLSLSSYIASHNVNVNDGPANTSEDEEGLYETILLED